MMKHCFFLYESPDYVYMINEQFGLDVETVETGTIEVMLDDLREDDDD